MSANKITLSWEWIEEDRNWVTRVRALDHRGAGEYVIYAIQRPPYCDRGKWHVLVDTDGIDGLDGQEGFPRYFFKLANLQEEMELWANERQSVRRYLQNVSGGGS